MTNLNLGQDAAHIVAKILSPVAGCKNAPLRFSYKINPSGEDRGR